MSNNGCKELYDDDNDEILKGLQQDQLIEFPATSFSSMRRLVP